ncbi:Uncharacterized SAM-dependent O-methyltransferase [hydrothermal vent metagenome]|uniref:Uncharacterized SAM-dependent O-methyltransferase n=1 Tax=hydrothermal vent metagenome TaxID=652676 RepID=A0A3B0U2X5_9ZZZZ
MELSLGLENYILENIGAEDEILKELDRETYLKTLYPRMLSGHWQGKILAMISKMVRPGSILEIGTFTGYSAICLAKGLAPGGRLITIEVEDELEGFAKRYFKKAGLEEQITQIIGDAVEVIGRLDHQFDLVFIDADKRQYCDYYRLVFDKVPSGGYIIADNTLWGGKVINPPAENDVQAKGIVAFNELIRNDKRVEKVILPVRDGITIIRKC